MGVTVRTYGELMTKLWDERATRELSQAAISTMRARTFRQGRDVNDQPFAPYSTRPFTMSFKAAQRIGAGRPTGGEPAYGRGRPRSRLQSGPKPKGWKITGRFYAQGYGQWKATQRALPISTPNPSGVDRPATSNAAGGQAAVNLTITGTLSRSIKVKRVDAQGFTIGVTGDAIVRAQGLQAKRPFMGLSPENLASMQAAMRAIVAAAIKRNNRSFR